MTGPLDAAWRWYTSTLTAVSAAGRVTHLWDHLIEVMPEGELPTLPTGEQLAAAATTALDELDDIAVLHLFAAFETLLRDHLVATVEADRGGLRPSHPLLLRAMERLDQSLRQGAIKELLDSFADKSDATRGDLLANVHEVRKYRNWVAHGRRGTAPSGPITPDDAKRRLEDFLYTIRAYPPA